MWSAKHQAPTVRRARRGRARRTRNRPTSASRLGTSSTSGAVSPQPPSAGASSAVVTGPLIPRRVSVTAGPPPVLGRCRQGRRSLAGHAGEASSGRQAARQPSQGAGPPRDGGVHREGSNRPRARRHARRHRHRHADAVEHPGAGAPRDLRALPHRHPRRARASGRSSRRRPSSPDTRASASSSRSAPTSTPSRSATGSPSPGWVRRAGAATTASPAGRPCASPRSTPATASTGASPSTSSPTRASWSPSPTASTRSTPPR